MKQYIVKSDSLTLTNGSSAIKGQVIDETFLPAANIPELLKNDSIEEYKEPKKEPAKKD